MVLLFIFAESTDDFVKEQITRVLLERLIVHRPHPWGLLITFIELIKNPRYNFWAHKFTHCAPDIEKVFDSVARSCMGSAHGGTGGAGGAGGNATGAAGATGVGNPGGVVGNAVAGTGVAGSAGAEGGASQEGANSGAPAISS